MSITERRQKLLQTEQPKPKRKVPKVDSPRKIIPPTIEQVRDYCLDRANGIDPQLWWDYYQANGWRVGRNKMQDWQAAVRTWERNQGNGKGRANVSEQKRREIIEGAKSFFE